MGNIRQPIKSTSIDKKNKIIEAGLKVFCKNGYYNTTTPEIASVAGVSTGIVYSYFKNKKDIFLQSLDLYFEKLYSPLIKKIKTVKFDNLSETITDIINTTIKLHKDNLTAHEEMIAMSHLDEDVHTRFMNAEQKLTFIITDTLTKNNIHLKNEREKVHIAYNLIENLSHEYVFHKHDFINYNEMVNEISRLVLSLFENNN